MPGRLLHPPLGSSIQHGGIISKKGGDFDPAHQSMSASTTPALEIRPQTDQSRPPSRTLILTSIGLGLAMWWAAGNDLPLLRWIIVLIAMGVSLIPPVNRLLA